MDVQIAKKRGTCVGCKNSKQNSKDKVFFSIPSQESRRLLWWKALKISPLSTNSTHYVCEDHFDLKKDIHFPLKHKLMGGRPTLKKNAIPHRVSHQNTLRWNKVQETTVETPAKFKNVLKQSNIQQTSSCINEDGQSNIHSPPCINEDRQCNDQPPLQIKEEEQSNIQLQPWINKEGQSNFQPLPSIKEEFVEGGTFVDVESETFNVNDIKTEEIDESYNKYEEKYSNHIYPEEILSNNIKTEIVDIECMKMELEDIKHEVNETSAEPTNIDTSNSDFVFASNPDPALHLEPNFEADKLKLVCHRCQQTLESQELFHYHYQSHIEMNPFSCSSCFESYASGRELIRHLHMCHSNNDKTFLCAICLQVFKAAVEIKEHIQGHFQVAFNCNKCNHKFSTPEVLHQHMLSHKHVSEGTSTETQESTGVIRQETADPDVTATETTSKFIKCKKCERCFDDEEAAVEHARTHNEKFPFACGVCNESFSGLRYLIKHMRGHPESDGPKKFVCTICSSEFMTAVDIKNHILNHSQRGTFNCEKCQAKFDKPDLLTTHMKTHRVQQIYCLICKKIYSAVSNFAHMNDHYKRKEANYPIPAGRV